MNEIELVFHREKPAARMQAVRCEGAKREMWCRLLGRYVLVPAA